MRGGLRRLCLAAGSRLAPPRASAPALPGPLPPRASVAACLASRRDYASGRFRGRRGAPRGAAAQAPPPPAASDPWEEVRDETTGQSYWWNVQTNETTALGAQKPDPSHPPPGAPPPAHGAGADPNALARPRSGGGMLGGFGAMVAEGMAFGTGSAIAHRAIGSIFGGGGGYYGGGGAAPPPGSSADSAAAQSPPDPLGANTDARGGTAWGDEEFSGEDDGGWFDGFDGFDSD